MSVLKLLPVQFVFVAFILLPFVLTRPQDESLEESKVEIRPGKYVPELYGAEAAKYVPDFRGQYQHVHIPYDGGYGDRGEKYLHDLGGIFRHPFSLGMKDHLRFMIDFNFNGSGWQVIQFEWVRDGDEERQYNFEKKNKIWELQSVGIDYNSGATERTTTDGETNVAGEDETNGENQINREKQEQDQRSQDASKIQETLRQLLLFVQDNILPTLA